MGRLLERWWSLVLAAAVAATVALGAAAQDRQPPIGAAVEELPIFDAHMHYKEDAWAPYPVGTVIELMDRSGVAMALVSSSPDDGTIKLLEYAPSRVVPEVRPYSRTVGPSNWMTTPGIAQYLAQRIEAYPHRGIGEFHVHRLDPDDKPLLQQVAALAMQHAIPIHIHSGAEPVRVFFEIEPQLTVIWAHAGLSEPPEVVGPMLDRYDRLYADTSYREHDILNGDGTIDPAWRAIIERRSDRLMVGSDTWVNGQWANYGDIIATNRRWLSQFPRDIAERIAFRNAEALFKRPVRRELIGKK